MLAISSIGKIICGHLQYIQRNMYTALALLCFVVVMYWLIYPYPSGLLHWHCGDLTIAPVPAKQPWWIWVNASCEFIMNDYITTTKESTTKPCAYFLGYTVPPMHLPCLSHFYIHETHLHIKSSADRELLCMINGLLPWTSWSQVHVNTMRFNKTCFSCMGWM